MTIEPSDLNYRNTIFGGRIIAVADQIAGTLARRHCKNECVTVALDSVRFLAPAKQGEELVFNACVNNVWVSSLEVGVKVFSRNPSTDQQKHILSAYFTFVAVDKEDKPIVIVDKIAPRTDQEIWRYFGATQRREVRLQDKQLP